MKLSIHIEHERTALILTQLLCRLAQLGYISLIICVGTKKAKVSHNKLLNTKVTNVCIVCFTIAVKSAVLPIEEVLVVA